MVNKRTTSIVVLGMAGFFILYLVLTGATKPVVGADQGMIAHDFTLPMWEKEGLKSLSDYEGDVIVLNLWASWCPPCIKEMPDLMQLADNYKKEGLSVLTVNMHKFERTKNDAPAFMEEQGITLPTFFDMDGEVAELYQVTALPTTYIMDRDMVILHVITGEVNYEGLETLIKPLFK